MVGKSLYFIPLGFHEIIITFILKYLVKIIKKNILKKSKKIKMLFQKIFWPILKGFFYMSSIEIFGKYILLTGTNNQFQRCETQLLKFDEFLMYQIISDERKNK